MAAYILLLFTICNGLVALSESTILRSNPNSVPLHQHQNGSSNGDDGGDERERETKLGLWSILGQENSGYDNSRRLKRSSFAPDFIFGAASSAYQFYMSWITFAWLHCSATAKCGAYEGGKGQSIWDTFSHTPGKILDGSNGDVAINFYNLYKDDVKLMKTMGIDAFRMSISWPRILPRGKLSEGVNKEGIAYYNSLFNELLANGITPYVTLFHWDLPQALEDEYGGFLSPLIIKDFRDFAEVCFREFGDRIKHWITINEPYIFTSAGYDGVVYVSFAPGRCSSWAHCPHGNSATEPYIVAHHLLLSHATIYALYKHHFQATQKGEIGMILITNWFLPYSSSVLDSHAAQRALDFMYGWFMDPIVNGDYPSSMRSLVGNRLPEFSEEESSMLKGSFDFIGLNYYTSNYATHVFSRDANISSSTDSMAYLSTDIDGVPICDPTAVIYFYVCPQGLRDLLLYTKHKYNISENIYVTETGIAGIYNSGNEIEDHERIDYFESHFRAVQQAIQEGVNVKGFFAWSFLDNFEWISGYSIRFGFFYVDYEDGLKRIPKQSALWFRNFLNYK